MDFDLNPPPYLLPNEDLPNTLTLPPSPSPPPLFDLNQSPGEETYSPTITITIPQAECSNLSNKKKNLTFDLKTSVVQMLLQHSLNGELPKGTISKVANHFFISARSVYRIWHTTKTSIANGSVPDVSSKLVKKIGRKKIEIDLEIIKSIPFRRRTSMRFTASVVGVSKATVQRRIKEGILRPHSNGVKPYLTNDNKKARLDFCLSMVDKGTNGSKHFFSNMYDQIHVDEKWFYMSKTSQKIYLHSDESEPLRTCRSKRFITKIMFLAAVARPRIEATNNREFNGKIGIWPFVFKEPAKRKSKNRVAGTLETKPILSVTKGVIRSFFLNNLLPAIKEKWPFDSSKTIFIQQDNVRPHIDVHDNEFLEVVERSGLDIRLCCQPPNSPDLNVLDLGFFRAIDSLQHEEAPTTVNEFVLGVEKAFDRFPNEELNNVFLTLQACMVEILKSHGGNNYKTPHMNKKGLIRKNQLPICIECSSQVMNEGEEGLCEFNSETQHP